MDDELIPGVVGLNIDTDAEAYGGELQYLHRSEYINIVTGAGHFQIDGKEIRVLPIMVDPNNKEQVSLVPAKAAAGYTKGYADTEFIADLPHFQMPFSELSDEKTYRIFQIEGDSMNPIQNGSYIICEYLQNWKEIKDYEPHVLVSLDEGIVFKRLELDLENSRIHLHSDNPEFVSYDMPVAEVSEIWRSLGFVSFNFPGQKK